jgi:hypothetical protein
MKFLSQEKYFLPKYVKHVNLQMHLFLHYIAFRPSFPEHISSPFCAKLSHVQPTLLFIAESEDVCRKRFRTQRFKPQNLKLQIS